jgi:hypothetical protein
VLRVRGGPPAYTMRFMDDWVGSLRSVSPVLVLCLPSSVHCFRCFTRDSYHPLASHERKVQPLMVDGLGLPLEPRFLSLTVPPLSYFPNVVESAAYIM